jgi:hypothetical protein
LLKQLLMGLALVAVSACAGWDETKQLDKLEDSEKEALCNHVYDAWGGGAVTSFCSPEDDGRLVPIMVAQGEREDAIDNCLEDSSGTRWVDCPVQDFVACADAVEAASDVCVSQTDLACRTFATCVVAVKTANEE